MSALLATDSQSNGASIFQNTEGLRSILQKGLHMGLITVVRELLYRTKLYLFGVRFYERVALEEAALVCETRYQIDLNHWIDFSFNRVTCEDLVLKRGRIVKCRYYSYVVEVKFSSSFPDYVKKYEDKLVFFNGNSNKFRANEKETIELILDIYLDYLRAVFNLEGMNSQTA